MYSVTIREVPAKRLAALRHRGDYAEIGATFDRLRRVFDARSLWAPGQVLVAVYHDDPARVPSTELSAHAGVLVGDRALIHELFDTVILPEGRHAVLELAGSYQALADAVAYLTGDWLADHGETPHPDRALHEVYLRAPADEGGALTEIHLPLA